MAKFDDYPFGWTPSIDRCVNKKVRCIRPINGFTEGEYYKVHWDSSIIDDKGKHIWFMFEPFDKSYFDFKNPIE
jgi:hypothetical protein